MEPWDVLICDLLHNSQLITYLTYIFINPFNPKFSLDMKIYKLSVISNP